MATEFYFTPELHLKDGRIIRDLDDAASFAREQEVRPGVDRRDESCTGSNARRARMQHIPLCDGWKSWTFLNRAGPGSRSIPLGFGGLNLYPSAAQAPPFGTILGFAR
jgi:hypothetical protein